MWKVTIEDDQASTTVVHLIRDEYSVGRAEENTIRLTERNISRRHARVVKAGERWMLVDLKSYNGCYVNGQRVSGQHELAHGDLVQLGDYRVAVLDETVPEPNDADKAITAPAAPRSQALLGQPDRLVMLVGPSVGAEFPLVQGEALLLGRGEECQIAINHPSVSRVHAHIQSLGDGRYEIVDRESANGVRVNGVELPRSILDARDVVELGDVILKFIPAGQIYVPGADDGLPMNALTLVGTAQGAAFEGRDSFRSGPPSFKIAALALGVVIVLVIGSAVLTRSPATLEPGSAQPADSAVQTLRGAQALLKAGDVQGAHRLAGDLPENSNARKSGEYRSIEAAWADLLFQQASVEQDPTQKRALLDQIARATSVDSVRRKRAANELSAMGSESIEVTDLPSARRIQKHLLNAGAPDASAPPPRSPKTLVRRNPYE